MRNFKDRSDACKFLKDLMDMTGGFSPWRFAGMREGYVPYFGQDGIIRQSEMFWDNTGKFLGIGTATPDKKLVVQDSVGNYVAEFNNTRTATYSNGVYITSGSTDSVTDVLNVQGSLHVKGNGYVGIGTTSPVQKLHVNTGAGELAILQLTNTATGTTSADGAAIGYTNIMSLTNLYIKNLENGHMVFETNAIERLRIGNDGNSTFSGNVIVPNLIITPALGAEKITNGTFTGSATGWTLGTGWNYNTNLVRKDVNGTGTLSQTSAGMVTPLVAGEFYTLTYTISTWTVGSVTPSIAGVTLPAVSANGTYSQTFQALSTADLSFLPTNTSRFYIDTISLKKTDGNLKGGSMWLDGAAGSTPTSGAGTRLMWIPAKPAFRAGLVGGTEWDDENIGLYSTAFGFNSKASGLASFAGGYNITASGAYAVAFGDTVIVSGMQSFGGGYNVSVTGNKSFGFGENVVVSGDGSFGLGGGGNNDVIASGNGSFAGGCYTGVDEGWDIISSGNGSFAWGYIEDYETITASGIASMAVGRNLSATADYAYAFGKNFTNSTADSFAIGFGQADFGVESGNVYSYGKFINNSTMRLKGYTVATLPAGTQGDTAFVTNALAPTYLTAIVGGGAVVTPVFYNGAAWVAY